MLDKRQKILDIKGYQDKMTITLFMIVLLNQLPQNY